MEEAEKEEVDKVGELTALEKQIIARIDQLSQLGRAAWLGLLAYLAFAFISLLGVRDADFFILSRQTQLPLVNVSIPTAALFVTAPVLAAALYIYLQILLLKLWDAIAAAPATIANRPLGEHIYPWLVNDVALMLRDDGSMRRRPLSFLTVLVTRFLVWGAAPIVLFGYWWGSMPAHMEWLTLLAGFWLLLALFAGFTTWWFAKHRLSARSQEPISPWNGVAKKAVASLCVLAVVLISWARTEGFSAGTLISGQVHVPTRSENVDIDGYPAEEWIDRAPGWSTLAPIDLGAVELVDLPDSWRTPETARKDFRETWCRREAVPMQVCDHLPEAGRATPPQVRQLRATWCREHSLGTGSDCDEVFAAYDERFLRDWEEERRSARSSLPKLYLFGADLRRARAFGASLVGATLYRARLSGADLSQAQLEGADLRFAELVAVDLSDARLEDAVLWGAYLAETDFSSAHLDGADLAGSRLDFADFWSAQLIGADLSSTGITLAEFEGARMQSVDLSEAYIVASAVIEADLRFARWTGAYLASAFHGSDLRGAVGLTQAQLDGSIGDEHTLLPAGNAPDTDAPFRIPSCWIEPPVPLDSIIFRFTSEELGPDEIRDLVNCKPGQPPSYTGRTLGVGEPYPTGHPLAAIRAQAPRFRAAGY